MSAQWLKYPTTDVIYYAQHVGLTTPPRIREDNGVRVNPAHPLHIAWLNRRVCCTNW
ncbi:MAG: hypothetical protein ABJA87_04230 [bacterium]